MPGGCTPSTRTASAEVFNINKNQWTPLPSLPVAVTGVKMAFLHGQLVLTGGESENRVEKHSWVSNSNRNKGV